MSKIHVYGSFTQALLFSGGLIIPKYLLENYTDLGINSQELVIILHLINASESHHYPSIQQLSQRMNIPAKEIEESISHLIEQKYISIEKHWDAENNKWNWSYNIVGLINELAERWAIESFKRFEAKPSQNKTLHTSDALPVQEAPETQLIKIFESELGRPLTSMECEFIKRWLDANISQNLIIEALRRGVAAGIRNFRYLDSILREWEKKGLRTTAEVEAEDAHFQERQKKNVKITNMKKKPASTKYEDFDL